MWLALLHYSLYCSGLEQNQQNIWDMLVLCKKQRSIIFQNLNFPAPAPAPGAAPSPELSPLFTCPELTCLGGRTLFTLFSKGCAASFTANLQNSFITLCLCSCSLYIQEHVLQIVLLLPLPIGMPPVTVSPEFGAQLLEFGGMLQAK